MKDPRIKPQWFQILLALADQDLHGLGIREAVLDQTEGRMRLWPAMLYGSLKQMAHERLIVEREAEAIDAPDDERRRYYGITPGGRRLLAAEVRRLERYVALAQARQVLDGQES